MALNPATAPPTKAVNPKVAAKMQKLFADEERMEKLNAQSEASTWFDVSAPRTRARRKTVRANFEMCVAETYDKHTVEEIWNIDTFVDYSKRYMSAVMEFSEGKIGKKIRTDVLYENKDALYWWAIRFIPAFGRILPNWHRQLIGHIHFLGLTEGLEQSHRRKNNLTDAELILFYRQLSTFHQGIENWKQHYAAWLLVYTTGVRPGSFTVCPGYEKGAALGVEGLTRPYDETLRWSDLTFVRIADVPGISVRITFRYLKNQRDPFDKRVIEGKKTFTFLPTRGERYELDASAVLLALAFTRGLFPFGTLEELLEDHHLFVPVNEEIAKQAVFVASSQAAELVVTTPMREPNLNPKLQQMCTAVGILERNTIYSFRRTSIIEVRRQKGSETAREVAGHLMDSATIVYYDTEATADLDIVAMRTGGGEEISRERIRAAFQQAVVSRVDVSTTDLATVIQARAAATVTAYPEYQEMEGALFSMLGDLATLVGEEPPRYGTLIQFATFKATLVEKKLLHEAANLDKLLAKRKTLRKTLTARAKQEAKDEMAAEH